MSQSNDSTGKEHYIVYADVKAQIIGVDTLENAVKKIPLGKKIERVLSLKAIEGKGLVASFTEDSTFQTNWCITLKGKIGIKDRDEEYSIDLVYKNKFLIFNGVYLLFFDNSKFVYTVYGESDSLARYWRKDECFHVCAFGVIWSNDFPEKWEDYFSRDEYYIDRDHCGVELKVKLSKDGNIIWQDKVADWCGIKVPVAAFSTWNKLEPYVRELVQKEKMDNTSYWNCQNCGRIVKSIDQPENTICNFSGFWLGNEMIQLHHWVQIGHLGTNVFQCSKCGQRVETTDVPLVAHCPEGSGHVWEQM